MGGNLECSASILLIILHGNGATNKSENEAGKKPEWPLAEHEKFLKSQSPVGLSRKQGVTNRWAWWHWGNSWVDP